MLLLILASLVTQIDATLGKVPPAGNLIQNPDFSSVPLAPCQTLTDITGSGYCIYDSTTNAKYISPWKVLPCSEVPVTGGCQEGYYEIDVAYFAGARNNIDLNPNMPGGIYQEINLPSNPTYSTLTLSFDMNYNQKCGTVAPLQTVTVEVSDANNVVYTSQRFVANGGTWITQTLTMGKICGQTRVKFVSTVPGTSCGALITNVFLVGSGSGGTCVGATISYSLISQDFAVANANTGSGTYSFTMETVPSDPVNYLVSGITLNGFPSITAIYVALNTFRFTGIDASCAAYTTYTVTATMCPALTQNTATSLGTCQPNPSLITSSFSIVSSPNQISPVCALTTTPPTIPTDLTASITDITSTPSSPKLFATDTWLITLQSPTLTTLRRGIAVTSVTFSDSSSAKITLAPSCFTDVVSVPGMHAFKFTAGVLPLRVTSYESPPGGGWTPARQDCGDGVVLAGKSGVVYTISVAVVFTGDGSGGLPVKRGVDEGSVSVDVQVWDREVAFGMVNGTVQGEGQRVGVNNGMGLGSIGLICAGFGLLLAVVGLVVLARKLYVRKTRADVGRDLETRTDDWLQCNKSG
ncbi:hypothetical protein HDU79_002703 [Rhizoclosmatium sp. JEL0117]|nr:hypothetical protein HDU79_002703 [Rhizoclosmatium sp. JEL0117]